MTQPERKLAGAALGKFGTSGLLDELIALVRKGNIRSEAAKRCKIAPRTFVYWMARGAANLAEYSKAEEEKMGTGVLDDFGLFRLEIEAAESVVEASLKDAIFSKALAKHPDSWKAASWLLERRFRARWGRYGVDEGRAPGDEGEHTEAPRATRGLAEWRSELEVGMLGVSLDEEPPP